MIKTEEEKTLMIGCWIHFSVDDLDFGKCGVFVLEVQIL